jgi:predicted AAA+ superfamily ATPase
MYPRHVLPILLEALQDTPVVLLNDARQTSKSTIAQQYLAGHPHRYLTFDNPVDAAGFIDGLEDSIILDDAVANYVSVVTKKRFMQWLNI